MQGAYGFSVKSRHDGGRLVPGLPPSPSDTEFAA